MKNVATLLALALAALSLVACGGDEATSAEATGKKLTLEADPGGELAYDKTEAAVEAGKVKVKLISLQGEHAHDIVIEDSKGKIAGRTFLVLDSSTSTTINLKPGEYTFYCSVRGHRKAGMEGTLTVE